MANIEVLTKVVIAIIEYDWVDTWKFKVIGKLMFITTIITWSNIIASFEIPSKSIIVVKHNVDFEWKVSSLTEEFMDESSFIIIIMNANDFVLSQA
jgi:hypothetical protein